jgi:hypothetical protein
MMFAHGAERENCALFCDEHGKLSSDAALICTEQTVLLSQTSAACKGHGESIQPP